MDIDLQRNFEVGCLGISELNLMSWVVVSMTMISARGLTHVMEPALLFSSKRGFCKL